MSAHSVKLAVVDNRRQRVPALAPDARRAALIRATIPLLHEHGLDVSTRQIAAAAGVAEGTIFGVFNSKSSLVVVSIVEALDPQPTLDALAALDRSGDLHQRVAAAAELVHARFTESAHLLTAARRLILASDEHPQAREQMACARHRLWTAVADVLAPDADRLRRSTGSAARLLLLMCGADTFGPFGDPASFSGAELASLLLDGLLRRSDDPTLDPLQDSRRA